MEPRSHSISTSMEICGGEGQGEESRDGDEGTASTPVEVWRARDAGMPLRVTVERLDRSQN